MKRILVMVAVAVVAVILCLTYGRYSRHGFDNTNRPPPPSASRQGAAAPQPASPGAALPDTTNPVLKMLAARSRRTPVLHPLESLNFKYRALVYAEFAKRGTFEPGPAGSKSVLVNVPPDLKRAEELRAAYWANMTELLGPDFVAKVLKAPAATRLEAGIHIFGSQEVTFQFDIEELEGVTPDAVETQVKGTVVRVSEVNVGSFGGGQMQLESFKKIYGDLAVAVLKRVGD